MRAELPAVIAAFAVFPGSFQTQIASYTGHSYQLQRASALRHGEFFSNVGSAQNGQTGTTLTLTDPSPPIGKAFYRIVIDR